MKQTIVLGVISVALLLLSGCASNGNSRYADEHKFAVDQQYVDAVDYASRQSGVRVIWVNPPTKHMPFDGDSGN